MYSLLNLPVGFLQRLIVCVGSAERCGTTVTLCCNISQTMLEAIGSSKLTPDRLHLRL